MGVDSSFFSFLNYEAGAYEIRFASMDNTITRFLQEGLPVQLMGRGVGTSNMFIGQATTMEVFVENFHIGLLYDSGWLLFLPWMILNVWVCIRAAHWGSKDAYFYIALAGVFAVNFLSCNITAYNMQLLYWQMLFMAFCKDKQEYMEV